MNKVSNIESLLEQLMTAKELNEGVLRSYSMYQCNDGFSWKWLPRVKPTPEQAADYIHCVRSLELYYEGRNQELTEDDADDMECRVEKYDCLCLDMRDVIFEENGKVGLKNLLGQTLVPAEFDAIQETYSCIDKRWGMKAFCVPVVRDGKYGLYRFNSSKREGKILTKKSYSRIYRYFSLRVPYYVCEQDGKIGLLDTLMGREVIPCQMDEIYESLDFDGCVIFKKNDMYGLLYGNVATEAIYDDVIVSSEDYAQVYRDGQWYWLDEDGKETQSQDKRFFGSWYDSSK